MSVWVQQQGRCKVHVGLPRASAPAITDPTSRTSVTTSTSTPPSTPAATSSATATATATGAAAAAAWASYALKATSKLHCSPFADREVPQRSRGFGVRMDKPVAVHHLAHSDRRPQS